MSFQLSPELDKNKVFLVRSSELEGRLDPNFYHPKRKNAVSKLKKSPFRRERLSSIVSFEKNVVSDLVDNNIYIGLENIESNAGVFIDSGKKESISTAFSFKIGHVLFPKLRPYLNKVFYAEFNGICSTEFHVLNSSVLDNKYLFIFLGLNIVVNQTSFLMSGNTLPRLQTEDIKNLLVPIPPPEIQSAIVAKMDAAYASKREKEAEAQRLLDSIDAYLLGELGIDLPEQEENTVQSRIFIRRFSEISGGRFDPSTYKKERIEIIERIKRGAYNLKPIYQALEHKNKRTNDVNEKALYIGLENVKSNTGEYVFSDSKESISSAGVFSRNDILFPKLRPYLNKVYLAEEDGICSTEFHIFCAYHDNNEYIANFLRSKAVVCQTSCLMSGNTLPRLQFEDIQKLLIPLPPLSVQTEIACRIAQIRSRAKQLQQEAKEGLEQAKRAVEAMIFGDA
jgi:restriction endonuclease S subunit